jgi:UDP-galactopyranose mutase
MYSIRIYTEFDLDVKFDEEQNNIEYLLSIFETQFWINHHWSIKMHKNYLYTLPFHFDQLKDFYHIYKSKSLNSWSHLKSIDFNSNLLKHLLYLPFTDLDELVQLLNMDKISNQTY